MLTDKWLAELAPGHWAALNSTVVTDLDKAKRYKSQGAARNAIAIHRRRLAWPTARAVQVSEYVHDVFVPCDCLHALAAEKCAREFADLVNAYRDRARRAETVLREQLGDDVVRELLGEGALRTLGVLERGDVLAESVHAADVGDLSLVGGRLITAADDPDAL